MKGLAVHIIDDDPAVREATGLMLRSAGYDCTEFASAQDFLGSPKLTQSGCAIVDIRMPGLDGIGLQRELVARGVTLPIIFMTGYADVPLAVSAMKNGAVDFVEKPCPPDLLKEAVERAFTLVLQERSAAEDAVEARTRLSRLTPRERDVLDGLVAGDMNKIVAYKLGISPRTVELHRARIMDKMHVKSLAELVKLAVAAGPLDREKADEL